MKRILAFLLAMMLVVLPLSGCDSDAEENAKTDKAQTKAEYKTERYFLYMEDETVCLLDTKTERTKKIDLRISVSGISNALVCEESDVLLAKVSSGNEEVRGIAYWDGKSDKAEYFGDNTELVRVSKDGEIVVYVEKQSNGTSNLFRYDAKKGERTYLAELVSAVSASEDCRDIFFTAYNIEDVTEGEPLLSEDLYYSHNGKEPEKIDSSALGSANVSIDGSVVAYVDAEERDGRAGQAYLWTKIGGKEKLPFEAYTIQVFSKNEIYFTDGDGTIGYYDGKDAKILTTSGSPHGHKLGRHLYYYRAATEGDYKFYIAYKGESIQTNIPFCYRQGNMGFVSADEQSVFGWGDDMLYRVDLKNGELEETELWETGSFSPRQGQFRGGVYAYRQDGKLYMNDKVIAEDVLSSELSIKGDVLAYKKDGTLCVYENGKTATHPLSQSITDYYVAWEGKAVSLSEDNGVVLYKGSGNNTKTVTISETADGLIPVYFWSCQDLTNCLNGVERTGTWYHGTPNSLIWRW